MYRTDSKICWKVCSRAEYHSFIKNKNFDKNLQSKFREGDKLSQLITPIFNNTTSAKRLFSALKRKYRLLAFE